MTDPGKKLVETRANTATFLLTKHAEYLADGHRVKVVIVGSGYTGVATAIAILYKVNERVIINKFVPRWTTF